MPHTERIDRLAALLVRYMDRFRREVPAPVVDRNRVARLRLAITLALEDARKMSAAPPPPVSRPRIAGTWLVPINLPFKIRHRGEPSP